MILVPALIFGILIYFSLAMTAAAAVLLVLLLWSDLKQGKIW